MPVGRPAASDPRQTRPEARSRSTCNVSAAAVAHLSCQRRFVILCLSSLSFVAPVYSLWLPSVCSVAPPAAHPLAPLCGSPLCLPSAARLCVPLCGSLLYLCMRINGALSTNTFYPKILKKNPLPLVARKDYPNEPARQLSPSSSLPVCRSPAQDCTPVVPYPGNNSLASS